MDSDNERRGLHFDNSPELYRTPPGKAPPDRSGMTYNRSPGMGGDDSDMVQLHRLNGERVLPHADYGSLADMLTLGLFERTALNLRNARLGGVTMPKGGSYRASDFTDAELDKVHFEDADMRGCLFDGASAAGAVFSHCDFRDVPESSVASLRASGATLHMCKGTADFSPPGEEE